MSKKIMNSNSTNPIRYDWSIEEIETVYHQAFPDLIYQAQSIHREQFPDYKVQKATLLSIKTGHCPEDCAYCPQSAHHNVDVETHKLLPLDEVISAAKDAKSRGSTRFCMGAAWREVKNGKDFDHVLDMVSGVAALDLEVCCTLGMLDEEQAQRLKQAGCHAYNHNLDTSPEFYNQIITTRTYEDRLRTLRNVRKAGITVCCGGILGMGESERDRFSFLCQLAQQEPHPESVPINLLVSVDGTPLAKQTPCDPITFVRMVATTRIVIPGSFVRLSAGRVQMSDEMQALCFIAGANSIHTGERLLTTPNHGEDEDDTLLQRLGIGVLESRTVNTASA